MRGLFAKPRYVPDPESKVWRCVQEDLSRLRHVLPRGVLARELRMGKARPVLRVVEGGQ